MDSESRSGRTSIPGYIRAYYRRVGVVLVVAVCVAGSAFLFSSLQTKMYRATVKLMYGPLVDAGNPYVQSTIDARTLQAQLESVGRAISRPDVIREARTLIVSWAPTAAPYSVTASVEATSSYTAAVIAAESASPRTAQVAAQAYAGAFLAWRKRAELGQIAVALQSVKDRMADFKTKASRNSLDYLTLMQQYRTDLQAQAAAFGNFRIVQSAALPTQSYSARSLRNAAVGFIVAILVGLGAILLMDQLDGRLRDGRAVKRVLRLPVLGELNGLGSAIGDRPAIDVASQRSSGTAEFDALRTNVEFLLADRGVRSLAFVGSEEGQGASSVACDIAISLALAGRRVTVVDGDVRRGLVAGRLGLKNDTGVTSVVAGGVALEDAVHSVDLDALVKNPESVGGHESGPPAGEPDSGGQAHIRVLCSGPIDADPALISASRGFAALVKQLVNDADVVVVVAPAFGGGDDAAAVCSAAEGLICVIDVAAARRRSLEAVQERLERPPCDVLGAVILSEPARAKSLAPPAVAAPPDDRAAEPAGGAPVDAESVQS